MMLGELGAEYVAFDGGADQVDFVSWWAEIFEIPCVAFDVASAKGAHDLVQAGADFVAFHIDSGASAADVQDQVRAFAAAIAATAGA